MKKLLSNNENDICDIIFSCSSYETRKKWVSVNNDNIYKYPLIHSINKNNIRYYYSSVNDKGHFGISKIIFGDSSLTNIIIDMEGQYGMTQHAIGIKVTNLENGIKLKNYLLSDKFQKIIKACSWSNFQIDWRLFTFFKKEFYNLK